MRVSIVIPTYNRAVYLESAIYSALAQDYPDLEVIISDNASTDNTEYVARSFADDKRVHYFRNPENIGMVANWRKAVFERATGDWFLVLSDDDALTNRHYITSAVKLIESYPNIKVVYSSSYIYDETLNTVGELKLPFAEVELGLRIFSKRGTVYPQDFALCNVLFNRSVSRDLEAFRNPYNLSCDTELFLRLCLRGDVGVIQEHSSLYRIHSRNLLKAASQDINLVIGSLDALVNPLLEAEKKQIDQNLIQDFIVNSGLKKEVFVSLLKASMIEKGKADWLYKKLQKTLGKMSGSVLPPKWILGIMKGAAPLLVPLFKLRRQFLFWQSSIQRTIFGNLIYFDPLKKKVYFIG